MDTISPHDKKDKPHHPCAYPNCTVIVWRRATYCRKHSAQKRANTLEGRKRMSKAAQSQNGQVWKGRKHTEETKTIIREKRAKQVISPEHRQKAADAKRGKPNFKTRGRKRSDMARAQCSASLLAKRDHLSQKGKERYARETEEQHERRLTPWIEASQKPQDTSIEVFVARWLDILGIQYEKQKRIGYYIVDFYIPSRNAILETNGCYWHGCELCGFNSEQHKKKRISDKRRTTYLQNKGYTVHVLWEHRIRYIMQCEPTWEMISLYP